MSNKLSYAINDKWIIDCNGVITLDNKRVSFAKIKKESKITIKGIGDDTSTISDIVCKCRDGMSLYDIILVMLGREYDYYSHDYVEILNTEY